MQVESGTNVVFQPHFGSIALCGRGFEATQDAYCPRVTSVTLMLYAAAPVGGVMLAILATHRRDEIWTVSRLPVHPVPAVDPPIVAPPVTAPPVALPPFAPLPDAPMPPLAETPPPEVPPELVLLVTA